MIGIPRVQARVGQIDEPDRPEHHKWMFDGKVTVIGIAEPVYEFHSKPFDTEKEARNKMNEAVRHLSNSISEIMAKDIGVDPTEFKDKYLDLKTGVMRSWNEH